MEISAERSQIIVMRFLLKYGEGIGRLHVPEADYFPADGTAVFTDVRYSF